MKLFLTLRPPIIDETSAYFNQAPSVSPQIVRSRGQFMPAECEPACDIEVKTEEEESIKEDEEEKNGHSPDENACIRPYISCSCSLVHPLEYGHEYPHHAYPPSIQPYNPCLPQAVKPTLAKQPPRPPVEVAQNNNDGNDTLNSSLLDLSFLTPLKESDNILNSLDLNSLSPYMGYPTNPAPSQVFQNTPDKPPLSPLHTPIKLLGQINDSGIFPSPNNLKFSTPMQDLSEILQLNGFTPSKENFTPFHYDPSYHHGNLEQMNRPHPYHPASSYYYKQ